MKKHLLKVLDNLKADLFNYSEAVRNKLCCPGEDSYNPTMMCIATWYILYREVGDLIHCLDMIQADCIAEINGTFFQDRVIPFSELEEEEEIFYDREKHNPFLNILEILHDTSLALSPDLCKYIQSYALNDFRGRQKMQELFPVIILDQNGSRITEGEMLQDSFKKNYSTETYILEGFDPMLTKLGFLAEARDPDSLIDILRLIE